MPTYQANNDLAGYQVALNGFIAVRESWVAAEAQRKADHDAAQAEYESAYADWEKAHDAWVADPGDPPGIEPVEPQPPAEFVPSPEPTPPGPPATYESRELEGPEEVDTSYGPALVVPPKIVLTGADGHTYAVSEADLARDYTVV